MENALNVFKKDELFSKAKLLRIKENISAQEVELSKLFVDLIEELREVIIEIEDYLDEAFPAGDCLVYSNFDFINDLKLTIFQLLR